MTVAHVTGPVLSTERAAEYCGIAQRTLYNLRTAGEGPKAYRNGRLVVFLPADLDEWLASRLVEDTPRAVAP